MTLPLFDQPVKAGETLVRSPLCRYQEPCSPRGMAVLGAPEDFGGCINRTITCGCGRTGESSTNTARRGAQRRTAAA